MTEINYVVSLGLTCFSAEYLRKVGLRLSAYPFDWVYSHPQMIIDCLDNNFANFLNKNCYQGQTKERFCRHTIYDTELPLYPHHKPPTFFHHNPLNQVDYNYLIRTIGRFRQLLKKPAPKLFLMTLTNRSGYIPNDIVTVIQRLKQTLDRMTPNAHLVVMNCLSAGPYYKQPSRLDHIDSKGNGLTIINLITSETIATLFSDNNDWALYKGQLDSLFKFNLFPAPDCVKEKDPW